MKRRSLLGGILGAVVAPKGAVEAATNVAAPSKIDITSVGWKGATLAPMTDDDYEAMWMADELKSDAYQAILRNVMPDFHREQLEHEARNPNNKFMDLDIESYRSWSTAAKVTAQRGRDFQRAADGRVRYHKTRIAERLFRLANGIRE